MNVTPEANDRMPKWVVFQGKDTFATLERDAEGNVKWRDAMVQHLTDYYMGDFLQSCVFYKKLDAIRLPGISEQKVIPRKFCGN